jgi:hypothetical protein
MPDRFTGGPLAGVAFELDALYFGAAWENTRRFKDWSERNAAHVSRQTSEGVEEPADLPRPAALCTWEWIAELRQLDVPESTSNPFAAINFRLDVLRALSTLPKSHLAAFVALMDGYGVEGMRIDLDEIARVMAPEGRRPWDAGSVRHALKRASRTVRREAAPIATKTSAARTAEREIARIRRERARFQAKTGPNRTTTSRNRPKTRLEQLDWTVLPPS